MAVSASASAVRALQAAVHPLEGGPRDHDPLLAAAAHPSAVHAVVSRGGRPDLAGEALPRVRCPTILIFGGADRNVLDLNQGALAKLGSAQKSLRVVPGATHLFEEPGALEQVALLAREWFGEWLGTENRRGA